MKSFLQKGLDNFGHSPFSMLQWKSVGWMVSVIALAWLVSCAGTKPEQNAVPKDSESKTTPAKEYNSRAIQHYMEGVSAKMQGNNAMAALEFQEALRYDSTSATIYSELAQTYLRLRKIDQAERILRAGLKNTEETREFLPMLGEVYAISRQYNKAEEVYHQILDTISDEELQRDALSGLGEIYARQKQFLKVADVYERLYQLDTDRIEYLKKAQRIYLQTGKYGEVKRLLKILAEDYPGDENYPLEMAKIYAETGNPDSAITILQNLIKSNPDEELKLLLGELYFRTGNPDSSYQLLKPFYEGDSTDSRVLYYLGGASLNLGEEGLVNGDSARANEYFRESENYYQELIQKDDSIRGGFYGLALSLRRQQEYDKAIRLLRRGLENFPDASGLHEQLGITYYMNEAYDSARAELKKALAIDSTLMRLRHFLAFVYDQLGMQDSAEVMYQRLLEEAPDEPLYLNNLAYLYAQQGKNLQRALNMVKTALKLEPENPSYLDTKGWIHYQLGEYQQAKQYIENALDLDTDNAEVLEHLGDVHMKLGNKEKARELYNRALQSDPGNQALQQKVQ